jgi:hypothetical protein
MNQRHLMPLGLVFHQCVCIGHKLGEFLPEFGPEIGDVKIGDKREVQLLALQIQQ